MFNASNNDDMFHYAIRLYHEGRINDSVEILERLVQKTQTESDGLEFRSRANLCEAYMRLGRYKDAVDMATILLARARHLTKEEFEGEAIGSLAMALEKVDLRGKWLELKPLLVQAFEIALKYNSNYWLVQHPETLGRCSVRMGEYDAGFTWLQEALSNIKPGVPEPSFFRTRVYQSLSDLFRFRADLKEAKRYAEMAVGTAEKNPEYSPHLLAMAKLTLAQVERAQGERANALQLLEEISRDAKQEKWHVEEQASIFLLGEIYQELGFLDHVEEMAQKAFDLAKALSLNEEEVLALISLGKALQLLGRLEDAKDAFRKAMSLSQERGYSDYFEESRHYLSIIE